MFIKTCQKRERDVSAGLCNVQDQYEMELTQIPQRKTVTVQEKYAMEAVEAASQAGFFNMKHEGQGYSASTQWFSSLSKQVVDIKCSHWRQAIEQKRLQEIQRIEQTVDPDVQINFTEVLAQWSNSATATNPWL